MFKYVGIKTTEDGDSELEVLEYNKPITLQNMYDYIDCDMIEMPCRKIKGVPFVFIIDEVGRINNKEISVIFDRTFEDFRGNAIICKVNYNTGEEKSLTDDEIQFIFDNVIHGFVL